MPPNRFDQPAAAVPITPNEEMKRIEAAQAIELEWWANTPPVTSEQEIADRLAVGTAHLLENKGELPYRVSEKIPEPFRVLDTKAAALLTEIAQQWREQLNDQELFLVVSSAARTVDRQQALIDQGYPGAPDSSHTRLMAFDIGISWLADNDPNALEVLEQTLQTLQAEGKLNYIFEPTVGVVHICVHPAYGEERS